jgi:hypothetical protein
MTMSQDFGISMPPKHGATPHRAPVRYLVVIDAGGAMVARLYLATRELVNECDASSAEIAALTVGLAPKVGTLEPEWDAALKGYNLLERAGAEVYTLTL